MSRTHTAVRGALLLGAAGVIAACNGDTHLVVPAVKSDIFRSYVAIGNSITAGYQSGGINDSTQRQSYALLLARQMGTRYAYPSLAGPGCPPPLNNLLNQTRVGGATSTAASCSFRNPASVTATLNNVAVPGVTSFDPIAVVGPAGNPLTDLFLGGRTQVQKALDAQPTFATIWVGNNDVLGPAVLNGIAALATPVTTFVTNYANMINQFMAGAPTSKGVLIGVVQVANVGLMFQAGVIQASAAAQGAASQVAGRPVALDPVTCAGANAGALVSFQYLAAIRARPAALPGTIYCQKISGGGPTDLGDALILDIGEQAAVSTIITGYNNYIRAKADSIGFAYFDPNVVLLSSVKPTIPAFPNLASVTAPFGQYFSLDGFHPSAAAHILIVNELIKVINTKYATTLAPVS